ncbi:MAG: phosphatidylserine decarboxylase, partial [Actinomycetota bacterium]|nr:phosphatidylserine decarboxylase [Actinomycetota bacterium]
VVVVQKAGLIARRISIWVEEGEHLEPGGKLGLIHLGSRTDVLFPAGSAEPLVRSGDKVRAGLTPLARYGVPR